MPRVGWERFLAWSSILLGALLFVLESLHGITYGGTPQGIIIDYIAAALLCYAGVQSLRTLHVGGAAGLLFGAWSYALCDAYRALWWRAEYYFGTESPESLAEPFGVFITLIVAGGLTLFFFFLSLYLAHPRPALERPGTSVAD